MIKIIKRIKVRAHSPKNKLFCPFMNGSSDGSKVNFSKKKKIYNAIMTKIKVVNPYQSSPGF